MRTRELLLSLALLASIAIVAGTRPAYAQAPDTSLWVTDGGVSAMLRVGSTLYLGGQFGRVGPNIGAGVPFDPVTAQPQQRFARIPGKVDAVLADGAGGWYVGGQFVGVAGAPRRNLVHLLADGSVATWAPDPDSEVFALALSGSTLYVGGRFEHLGGQPHYKIGAVDIATGLATAFDPNPPKPAPNVWPNVTSLAIGAGVVYAGGRFFGIGGQPRNDLAALDPITGAATTWDAHANGPVFAIADAGATIYVGGAFSSMGGATRVNLAQLDAATAVATSWDPRPNVEVWCLTLTGSTIFAGGGFTTVGVTPRHALAAFDRASGALTAFDPEPGGGDFGTVVYGLAESAGTLYVAGDFATIAGQARRRLAALDATTGVATAWDPDVNASASAVAVQGGTVFAGGNFWLAGGVPRSNLAALDLATGHPTAWAPIANARVLTMVTDGTSLYLGGYFTQLQGATHHYLARMDLASAAVAAWDPGASDVVTCLDLAGSRLYAGGYFLNMGGVSGPTLAAIDAASGVTQSWVAGTAGGPVNHIVADPAAGAVSVVSQGGFWRFSAADAHTIWSANIDGAPYTLAQLGSTLYVGGYFHTVNGVGRNYVAALDATTGGLLPWDPESDGIVNSLATDGTRVYASGGFANIGGSARAAVAVLDASTGIAGSYDAQCGPGTFANSVYLAAPIGADLFLTGSFGSCGNVATPGFARMPAAPPLSVPPALPLSLRLDVAPMPALTTTRVSWSLPTPGRVWLDVLDVQGRSVATLLDGAVLTAGPDSRMLDTRGWRPGVYLARLRTPTAHVMRRIVVER